MKGNTDTMYTEIKSGEEGPRVLISAGVHGDEYEPIVAAIRLIKTLPDLIKKGSVSVFCIANPSAYEQGNRLGVDGLDLARICPGRNDGSESEKAAFEISEQIKRCDYFIDMHTGGALFDIMPMAGYMMHSDAKVLATQRRMAACFSMPVIWGTDSKPNGRTLSIARDAKIPAIYLEYGGGGAFNEVIADEYVNGCLQLLAQLNMTEMPIMTPAEPNYWVEDPSPDSGHLQAKMLSPYEGIFVPSVRNSERVKKGQKWGILYDPKRQQTNEVMADSEGIVLFIRRSAKVKIGDSLGGILKLDDDKNEE